MKKAVIFDMDGVIVDSENYWQKSEFILLKKWIPDWKIEDHEKIIGLSIEDIYYFLAKNYQLKLSYADFFESVNEFALTIYNDLAQLMPGFLNLIQSLYNSDIPIGLASSSRREWIDIVLDRFEIRKFFKIHVSAEEINGPGKPLPDIYVEASRRLGFEPCDCVGIEDSENGLRSSKSAGLYSIGFRNGINQQVDMTIADEVIEGFENFDLNLFS